MILSIAFLAYVLALAVFLVHHGRRPEPQDPWKDWLERPLPTFTPIPPSGPQIREMTAGFPRYWVATNDIYNYLAGKMETPEFLEASDRWLSPPQRSPIYEIGRPEPVATIPAPQVVVLRRDNDSIHIPINEIDYWRFLPSGKLEVHLSGPPRSVEGTGWDKPARVAHLEMRAPTRRVDAERLPDPFLCGYERHRANSLDSQTTTS